MEVKSSGDEELAVWSWVDNHFALQVVSATSIGETFVERYPDSVGETFAVVRSCSTEGLLENVSVVNIS